MQSLTWLSIFQNQACYFNASSEMEVPGTQIAEV